MSRKSEVVTETGKKLDMAAIRTTSGIFKRLIIQQVQNIWHYGVQIGEKNVKAKLGEDFDYIASCISENAALHSVSYGFWNYDRLQMFTALEYFPLKDERTGADMCGIRFWQIDEKKPLYIQLFEIDGWTEYKREDNRPLELATPKQSYRQIVRADALGVETIGSENYAGLPVIAMYANKRRKSELTYPIKSKIDLMDFIQSGFGDEVLRTKVIYWVLQGYTSDREELRKILQEINEYGIVAPQDTTAADARTIDLPFGAVQYALDKLEKGIYLDFMGMQLSEITGGSLTNVAIETAQFNLTLKTSDFEWQAFDFVRRLLKLQNIKIEDIKFKKKSISNDMEITQQVIMSAPYLDEQTILEKLPIVEPDEVQIIMQRKAMEQLGMGEDEPEDGETEPTDGTEGEQ